MAQDCPRCGLINPPNAERCDCGWDFVNQRQEQSYLEPKHHGGTVAAGLGIGAVLLFILIRLIIGLLSAAKQN